MIRQTSKVALVTGADHGIGAAVAERLADDGFTVVVNYASSAAPAEALVTRIEAAGGRAQLVQADVSDTVQVRHMFDAIDAAFGGVDVVVNNAGIAPVNDIHATNDATFGRLIDVNLHGSFNVIHEAASRLREGGRVVNLSSPVTSMLQPAYGIHLGTRTVIEAITAVFAKELAGRGITVNAIAPSTVEAEQLDEDPQAAVDQPNTATRLRHFGRSGDIASIVAFLVGPDAGRVSGQTLHANAGITTAPYVQRRRQ